MILRICLIWEEWKQPHSDTWHKGRASPCSFSSHKFLTAGDAQEMADRPSGSSVLKCSLRPLHLVTAWTSSFPGTWSIHLSFSKVKGASFYLVNASGPLFLQEETEGREQCDMPRIPQMSWETAAIKAPYFLDPQPFLGHQAALCTTLYKAGMCYCTFFSLFPGGKGAIHRSKGKGMEVNLRMNVKDLITEDGKAW